jgi:Cu/Ag efflux protein CusF
VTQRDIISKYIDFTEETMKKTVFTIGISVVALGFTAAGFAQDMKQNAQGEQQVLQEQPRKTALYHGVVQEVDLKNKIVMAGKPKSELGMAFHASKAKLVGYKELKDIKPGDKVKVEFDAIKSKTYAVTITKEE